MVMSFRRGRRTMALRPIHRIKHVVDGQFGLGVNVRQDTDLVKTVDAPVLGNNTEVETGSKVNGIYLNVEAYATSGAALSNIYIAIFKNPGNNITMPNPNVVGVSDNKRFFIHQEMKMLQKEPSGESGGNPRVVFNGVIVIPRGFRRFGPDDRLGLMMLCPGITAEICFQCHYKEFR